MAADNWPSYFPCPQIEGYTEQQEPTTIRSNMDTGPAKVRRRYTNPAIPVNWKVALDKTQMVQMRDFYNITLQAGVLRFNMKNPWEGVVREYRFKAPPKIDSLSDKMWTVNLELEYFRTP